MQLTSKTYDAADFSAVQELYHSNGWTDGLPVVPPTREAVEECLEWAVLPPDQLIGIEPVRGTAVTAEKLAINAVMAGCLPMHFPVVVAAWTAMMQEEFLLHGATASTGGCAVLLVLNGPIRQEISTSSSFNALGSSDRATSVIGRALRLCLINILEVRPGGKSIRDTANNIKIDFLLTGDFPGDGKPKPVAFPDPGAASLQGAKYRVVSLPRLIEMKLASGMTAPHRLHDLADILRLIREAGLPKTLAVELDPYVRAKFDELWILAQHEDDDY